MPDVTPSLRFGFPASVALRTEWGPCRTSDLAHLTRKRDQAIRDHERASETRASMHAWSRQQIEQSRDAVLAPLKVIDTSPLMEAFASALEQLNSRFDAEQVEAKQLAAADIANMLPPCFVDTNVATVPIVGVTAADALVAEFVDVTIAVQIVAGPKDTEVKVPVKIRCTPDVLFATTKGDVPAASLVGASILRVLQDGAIDSFVVSEVVPVLLDAPASVYGIDVGVASSVCIGSDSTAFAVVRTKI